MKKTTLTQKRWMASLLKEARTKSIKKLWTVAIVLAVVPSLAKAQVTTTTVQGTIYRADGSAATGTLILSWPAFLTIANQAVAAGSITTSIGQDGFVSVNLAPNLGATPEGSYYTAIYHLSDGTVGKEYWVVPSSSIASIAAVRAQLAPATVAVQPVTKDYVASSIASIASTYIPLAGGTMSGPLVLSADPTSQNQAATKRYADQLAAADLPLAGGNMVGTLSTPNSISKLPRVDVRHPDFGASAGCTNVADPTGVNDSTCAIQAAIAFAAANAQVYQYPSVYLPTGTYKISSAIRVPCQLQIVGDGANATAIKQANNSANGFTVYVASTMYTNGYTCSGGVTGLEIMGTGHLHTGTLLEVNSASGYSLTNIKLFNSGGRGLSLQGSAERIVSFGLEIDTVRWPLILTSNANEDHFFKLNIAAPGQANDGYCYSVNCVNGAYPTSVGGTTLVSASRVNNLAAYVVSGTPPTNLQAGHLVSFSGITGDTTLNCNTPGSFCKVASITNNSPFSGEFTITVNNPGINSSGTVSGAANTFAVAISPDIHSAVWVSGVNVEFHGGSIKSLQYAGGFQVEYAEGTSIQHFYLEGYPYNNQPRFNAGITLGGYMPYTTTTAVLPAGTSATTVAVADTSWWPTYVNDPADLSTAVCGQAWMMPQDGSAGSTATSSYVPTLQQGQYEIVTGCMVGDGLFHIVTRNNSGSTAPSSTIWPANSIVHYIQPTSFYGGGIEFANNHFHPIDQPSATSGYVANVSDTIPGLTSADVIAGFEPDGLWFNPVGSAVGTRTTESVQATLRNNSFYFGDNEPMGEGYVKVHNSAVLTVVGAVAPGVAGESSEVTKGGLTANTQQAYFQAVQYATGVNASLLFESSTAHLSTASGLFTQLLSGTDARFGPNPGSTGNTIVGSQFANSYCWYDTPAASVHGQNRFCMKGSPSLLGSNAGWEFDEWNGSAWVNAFSVAGVSNATANLTLSGSARVQGSITASTINGEITVDGVTYSTLNAAWTSAASLASSTGHNQTIKLGPGTFAVTAAMTEPNNGACVSVIGSGGTTVAADSAAPATTLNVTASLGGDVFYLGNTTQAQGCTFKDLNILAATNATHAFELQYFRGLLMENVTVNDTAAEGILLGEESTTNGHQSIFLLRNVTVSYSASAFTPANRPAYGIHMQQTAIDSRLDNITVRNALTASLYNEGTGNTGYLIHGFGYPYTCTTAPCSNNDSSSTDTAASYATNYVIYDAGGSGTVWTDTYIDSPAIAGFYIGAKGVTIHGGHIQWPDVTSFPSANLAYVASTVTNNLLIADVDCLGMNSSVNWITYALTSGNPPTYASVHHLTGCGNYYQSLEPANTTGFSSGGANINDTSGAVPRVWSTPVAASGSYPAYAAQMYTGYQGDAFQAHFSANSPFFNVTYQGTVRSNGGIALSTVINTASTLTLTTANKNVIANAASAAQTLTLPSCFTAMADGIKPTGLELTVIKSDTSSNAVTLQTVNSQTINYQGTAAASLAIGSAGKRSLVCGPDYNWYAY